MKNLLEDARIKGVFILIIAGYQFGRVLWPTLVAFNIFMLLFFGSAHQGGVVPSLLYLQQTRIHGMDHDPASGLGVRLLLHKCANGQLARRLVVCLHWTIQLSLKDPIGALRVPNTVHQDHDIAPIQV
jgi:hypothetical protein